MSFRIDSTVNPPGTSEGSRTIVAMTCMCVDGVSSARKAASRPVSRCILAPIEGPRAQRTGTARGPQGVGGAAQCVDGLGLSRRQPRGRVVHVQRVPSDAALAAPHAELLRGLVHVRA